MWRLIITALVSFSIGIFLTLSLAQKASVRRDEIAVSLIYAGQGAEASHALQQGNVLEAYAHEFASSRVVSREHPLFPYEQIKWEFWLPFAYSVLEPLQVDEAETIKNLDRLKSVSLVRSQHILNELSRQGCVAGRKLQ